MPETNVHILSLSSWYPTKTQPFLGNFIQRQTKLLAQKYKVTVIHTIADESVAIITVNETSQDGLREIFITHPRGKNIFSRIRQQRKALKHGLNLINGVDVVIGNILLPKGHQFVTASKHFNCPLIYIEQGSYFRFEKREIWTKMERFILKIVKRNVNEAIAVSEFLKKDLKKDFKQFDIKVIGNYVDTSMFCFKPKIQKEIKHFLHVSTLDENTKNPAGIFEACVLLKEITSKFKLKVICDEDFSKWQKFAHDKGISDNVEFIGPFEWEDLPVHYQQADAFILFSEFESFSAVLAEAWATGTPVISTSVGIAHNMSDKLGIQVQISNPESLCEAMQVIVEDEIEFDPELIVAHAQNFSESTILNKWTAIIEKYVG